MTGLLKVAPNGVVYECPQCHGRVTMFVRAIELLCVKCRDARKRPTVMVRR